MKRLLLLFAVTALVAIPAAADGDTPTLKAQAPQVADAAEQAPAGVDAAPLFADETGLQSLLGGDCTDEALEMAIIPPPWPCPFGAPRCKKHDDCDAYCGDPRFGCCGCSG